MSKLYLSPNEEAHLKQSEEKQRRIQRLKEVSFQEAYFQPLDNSAKANIDMPQGSQNGQRKCSKEATKVSKGRWRRMAKCRNKITGAIQSVSIQKLRRWPKKLTLKTTFQTQFQFSKDNELAQLKKYEELAFESFGLGMKRAKATEEQKTVEKARFRSFVIEHQKKEDNRFFESLKEDRQNKILRELPMNQKRALLHQIAVIERERAIRAAQAYRHKAAQGLVTNIEIPHRPVGKREIRKSGPGFDETCYHRDFVAVKCSNERDESNIIDAWDAAKLAEQSFEDRMEAKQKRAKVVEQSMAERYKQAFKGVKMDKVLSVYELDRIPRN